MRPTVTAVIGVVTSSGGRYTSGSMKIVRASGTAVRSVDLELVHDLGHARRA